MTGWIMPWRAVLLWVLLMIPAGEAWGHHPALSSMIGHVTEEKVDVFFELHAESASLAWKLDRDGNNVVDQSELVEGRAVVVDYLDARFAVTNNTEACSRGTLERLEATEDLSKFRVLTSYRCSGEPGSVVFHNSMLLELVNGHKHVARIQLGEVIHHHVFERGADRFTLDASPLSSEALQTPASPDLIQVFVSFFWQGIVHILIGPDHLLFILALVLVVRRLRELALVVTAFTVAHSVTLGLGALEIVTLPPVLVESAIALSIVYVGVENIVVREPRARYVVTFLFGLVHGFGFSSVLLDLGLGQEALVSSLLAFNLGVEIGQLAWVAPAFLGMAALRRGRPQWQRPVIFGTSAIVAVCGVGWFLQRALGV